MGSVRVGFAQLRAQTTEARERANASEASAATLNATLRMVRTTVEEEKRRWIEELRAARDDVCRLRIELAHAKEKAKMSGGRREASKPIDVYADEESDEDASSSDSDARAKSESLSLTEAAETLRELSLALCDAAIERRLIKKHTPKKRAKAKPIGKYAAKTKDPKQTTPAGETARRALRARHAMKVLNYAEPSLKTKLRRPSGFDEIEERKVVGLARAFAAAPARAAAVAGKFPPTASRRITGASVHHQNARQSTREISARRHRRRPQNRTAVFADSPARRAFDSARRLPRARPRSQDASTVTFDPPSFIHPILFHPIFSIASETFARRSFVASRFV